MKFLNFFFYIALINLAFNGCSVKNYFSNSRPISHEIWNNLTQKHVSESGQVNYMGFLEDSITLNSYLDLLSQNHPNKKNWSRDQQLAYWINAYNAFTVKLIVDNYPVKSIKDIKKGIPFVNSVWDIKFIKIENATYDLNNIEHGIVRKQFDDPRIHVALNCASVSCPKLRNEAFTSEQLEKQLDNQMKYFINNPMKNKITSNELQLSKIMKWYKGDFTKKENLIDLLNRYSDVQIGTNVKISYLDYDWNLNE